MDTKILILGGTGMLGHTLFYHLSQDSNLDVYTTIRHIDELNGWFSSKLASKIIQGVYAENFDSIMRTFAVIQPDIVINCIGIIKQLPQGNDPLAAISINSLLPHRISLACRTAGFRMIHLSTDCVFNGERGNYCENDPSDALDMYGRSKFLGEVSYSNCLTLRTSFIGHELTGKLELIEWFLAQEGTIRGFTKAIYSGIPTIELAHVIHNIVLPNKDLSGLFHLSSEPISKYNLLRMVADKYKKQIDIEPFDDFVQDRSLDSTLFTKATGYVPPSWPELVDKMYQDFVTAPHYRHRHI